MIKQASANGHKSTAHVVGIAASMASAIACACDELKMDSNSFMMIHNPFSYTMGDANDMRKEAEVLDQMRDALVAIYRTKFDATDEVLKKMMDDETWIIGEQAELFNLKCEVIPTQEPLKAAAYMGKDVPRFMNAPKVIEEMIMKKKAEMEKQASDEVKEEVTETKADEIVAEPTVEEPMNEESAEAQQTQPEGATSEAEPKDEEVMVTKAECDKRVSGMQSAMAKQMDAMKKDYEAKIADFEVQIKVKDEELNHAYA